MIIRCLKKIPTNITTARFFGSAILAQPTSKLDDFRTNENVVTNHSTQHLGRYYQISPEVKKLLFSHGGFTKMFEKQVKTFTEACLMIREPAIEIIEAIKKTNFNNPTNRFVIYGENGVGKSVTLAHLIHYGHQNDFVLVHVPWVANWMKKPKEIANSSTYEGCIDLPLDAAAWLIHFKTQNTPLLKKLNLKTSQDYVWSKREMTPKDSTLLEFIDHGINRIKFASDTVCGLIHELKQKATAGQCKVMVAIDGYNAFFYPKTKIINESKQQMTPDKITLTKPFLDITNYDWCNGVCLLTVDKIALTEERWNSYLPRYLLGKEGFEHLDPFIPVKVDNFNDLELQNCINYYLDRKWIQNTESGFDQELKFLSGNNPYKLMNICASL